MMWDLPTSVEIDGDVFKIRNDCDYRVVLDTMIALNDESLEMNDRAKCALFIFYEDLSGCRDIEKAINEMIRIISNETGEEKRNKSHSVSLMDWERDFSLIVPPVSRVLGYDVRTPNKYTHWWTFLSGYMEIGSDCTFSNIISIRSKKSKGKKLEKWEEEFYREHFDIIDLPNKMSEEEIEWLNAEW